MKFGSRLLGEFRALFLTTLVVGALAAGVDIANRSLEQQSLADLQRETSALALVFATHTDFTFRTVDLALQECRTHGNEPPQSYEQLIKHHLDLLNGAVVQTAIVNRDGLVTYSAPIASPSRVDVQDREFFTEHKTSGTDRLLVGRPIRGKLSGKWTIPLSRPIISNGKFAGVVLITVDPAFLVNFYQRTNLGSDGAARVIRDTGEVMARSSDDEKFIGKVINPSPYADPGAPLQGSFRRKAQADGVDRLSSYVRLPQFGLTVVIGPSVDERLAPIYRQLHRNWIAAAVVSLLLLVFAVLLHRSDQKVLRAHGELEASFGEISRLKEALIHKVFHDPLTDVHNRRYMEEVLPREFALAKREGFPLSLAMVDLDHFKRVNDTYGHSCGDIALQTVARVLQKSARESDLLFRYGGEEFLLVLPNTTAQQAHQKMEQIRKQVEATKIDLNGHSISMTLSAGISSFPTDGDSTEKVLGCADQALYQAKNSGRNAISIYE